MDETTVKRPYWQLLAMTVFAFAFAGGFSHAGQLKSYYIPFILRNMNHGLYPTDLFVNTESLYHTLFFKAAAFPLRFLDMTAFFIGATFLAALANALIIFEIAFLLFKNRNTALLSTALLLFGKYGMSVTMMGIMNLALFEPSQMAKPLLLFAVYMFLKARYRTACLLTSLLFYIQGVEAFYLSLIFLSYFIARFRSLPRGTVWQALLLLSVPALPAAWVTLSGNFANVQSAAATKQWLDIIRFRSFFHLFPLSWGKGDWFNYSGWAVWAYLLLRYSKRTDADDKAVTAGATIALLCAAGTIFVEVFPVPIVVKLHLWRSTMFALLFLLLYIGKYLSDLPKDNWIQVMLFSGTIASLFFSSLASYRLIPCLAFLNLAYQLRGKPAAAALLTVTGMTGVVYFAILGGSPKETWLFFITLAATAGAVVSVRSGKRAVTAVVGAVFIAGAFAINIRYSEGFPARTFSADWIDVQLWAERNTPVNAIFATPPYLEGFRINSRRGTVAELKDGAACMYDIEFTQKWWERINALGYSDLRRSVLEYGVAGRTNYNNLTGKEIRELGRKYGACYIIMENAAASKLKPVYSNSNFSIYPITPL